jgi:hypothetical protein
MKSRNDGCVKFGLAIWSVALLLLLKLAVPVFAQNAAGTILGVVKDSQGGAVAGATVTIRNTETGLTRSLMTGEDGAYRAPALPVGTYSVKVEKAGFKSATHDGLVLAVTQEMTVGFDLEIGASTQEVVVTGETPQVETTTSTIGGLVDEQRMAELPLNGRNYIDLTLLQVGVSKAVQVGNINSNTQGTWMSSNGAPVRSNNITLDGTSLINQQGATSASPGGNTLGVDGIREYKVVTDMFGAEYGMTMGSQVVMTSKSGSNQWHGDAFEYLRNEKLDANINKEVARRTDSSTIQPRPPHKKNNFGGSFGGPIKKDKTFFYAVYEGLREVASPGGSTHVLQSRCYDQTPGANFHKLLGTPTDPTPSPCADIANPTSGQVNPNAVIPAELEPYPNSGKSNYAGSPVNRNGEDFGQIRLDQNIGSADSLFGRYTTDKFHADNDSKYPEYKTRQSGYNNFFTIGENHIFSAQLLNSARISFARTNGDSTNYVNSAAAVSSGIAAWAACPTLTCPGYSFTNNGLGQPQPTGAFIINYGPPGNFGATGGNEAATLQNIYTFSDDVFYTKGHHALKFGILFNRYNQAMNGGAGGANSVAGEIVFAAQDQLLAAVPQLFDLRSLTAQTSNFFVYNTIGMYAQDDYRVASRLTLNLGLRYEFNTTPHDINGRNYTHLNLATDPLNGTQHAVMQNDSLRNFSPRVGFAWDITGKGKTALRGGFGEYFDVGNIGSTLSQYSFAAPPESNYYVVNPVLPGAPAFSVPMPTPGSVPAQFQALHTLDYYSKQPHILQYNLTAQQQLPWNLALQVGYVGSRGINLFRLTEENPFKTVTCTGPNCIPGQPFWGMDPTSPQGRMNPNFGTATEVTTGSSSWYNALEVGLTMKSYHGVELQTAYTFSRNFDTTQGQQYVFDCFAATGSGQGIDPTNTNTDKGPTCFDATHNLRLNFLYHFPSPKSNGFLSKALGGWWMGNIISIQSGYPFNVNTIGLISNNGVFAADQGERPNIVTSANLAAAQVADPGAVLYNPKTAITGNPDGWFNPHMFTLVGPNAKTICNQDIGGPGVGDYANPPGSLASYNPSTGTGTSTAYGDPNFGPTCYFGYLGDEPRNDLRGARLRSWDLSINKDTKLPFLGENGMLEFRAEMFNLLNHANWGFISNTVFAACAPTRPNGLLPYGGLGNGSCAGSNEGGADANGLSNYNGLGPLRQIQLALKIIF